MELKLCTVACERNVQRLFKHVGRFIGLYPWLVIASSLLLTFISSFGMLHFQESNDVTEFVPHSAPSRMEHRIAVDFLEQVNAHIF